MAKLPLLPVSLRSDARPKLYRTDSDLNQNVVDVSPRAGRKNRYQAETYDL